MAQTLAEMAESARVANEMAVQPTLGHNIIDPVWSPLVEVGGFGIPGVTMGYAPSRFPSANLMSFPANNHLLPVSYNQAPGVSNALFWNLGDSTGQDIDPSLLIPSQPASITQPSNNNSREQGLREPSDVSLFTEQPVLAPSLPLQVVSSLPVALPEPGVFTPQVITAHPQLHEQSIPEGTSSVPCSRDLRDGADGDREARATRAAETTSNGTESVSSPGTSAAPGALPLAPLGEDASSVPQQPFEMPHTYHDIPTCPTVGDSDDQTGQIYVERVIPAKGSTAGGPEITILGENFPEDALFVRFGDSIARAVGTEIPSFRSGLYRLNP